MFLAGLVVGFLLGSMWTWVAALIEKEDKQ